jgi:hypothetical protein
MTAWATCDRSGRCHARRNRWLPGTTRVDDLGIEAAPYALGLTLYEALVQAGQVGVHHDFLPRITWIKASMG